MFDHYYNRNNDMKLIINKTDKLCSVNLFFGSDSRGLHKKQLLATVYKLYLFKKKTMIILHKLNVGKTESCSSTTDSFIELPLVHQLQFKDENPTLLYIIEIFQVMLGVGKLSQQAIFGS